jgi:hypothetical protein
MRGVPEIVAGWCRRHPLKAAGATLAAAAIIFLLEPLEPRFQGLTARQWIARNADRREFPRREVVEYFGDSAVPVLLRESQPSGLFRFAVAFQRKTGKAWLNTFQSDDFDRRMACADWAKRLLTMEPEVFARSVAKAADNQEALEVARLFYGDRYLREALRSYARQSTNVSLQARATGLLQYYREMI